MFIVPADSPGLTQVRNLHVLGTYILVALIWSLN
jgi:hypothetical protein